MDIHISIVVKHIETNSQEYVQVRRLKHQKVLVPILEHKLINKRILLFLLEFLLNIVFIDLARTILECFQSSVSCLFIIGENEIPQREFGIPEPLLRN